MRGVGEVGEDTRETRGGEGGGVLHQVGVLTRPEWGADEEGGELGAWRSDGGA